VFHVFVFVPPSLTHVRSLSFLPAVDQGHSGGQRVDTVADLASVYVLSVAELELGWTRTSSTECCGVRARVTVGFTRSEVNPNLKKGVTLYPFVVGDRVPRFCIRTALSDACAFPFFSSCSRSRTFWRPTGRYGRRFGLSVCFKCCLRVHFLHSSLEFLFKKKQVTHIHRTDTRAQHTQTHELTSAPFNHTYSYSYRTL